MFDTKTTHSMADKVTILRRVDRRAERRSLRSPEMLPYRQSIPHIHTHVHPFNHLGTFSTPNATVLSYLAARDTRGDSAPPGTERGYSWLKVLPLALLHPVVRFFFLGATH